MLGSTVIDRPSGGRTMMVGRQEEAETAQEAARVLIIDNDGDVTELVTAILTDEGYEVETVQHAGHDELAGAVGRFEPDCILLDGTGPVDFGRSWDEAAYLSRRPRSVPTVMFTAHASAAEEARTGTSDRAMAAGFAAVLAKPFGLDELLETVATASGRSDRFDRSDVGDRRRTEQLVEALSAAGATDIRTSERREWATFISPDDDHIYQLYWWQRLGLYIVGRYDEQARLERVGQFYERAEAIASAFASDLEAAATA
jgi:CheY-like chemotaxis protein